MNRCTERLYNGLVKENPTFVLMLGMCPTLAVTTSATNGVGMGLSTTVVLVLPSLYDALGLYIPLIVVNCIILGRAESYASKNPVLPSIFDGIGMGLGFTVGLTCIGIVRELIGAGQIFGKQIIPIADEAAGKAGYVPVTIFILAPGAFLVLAGLVALQNKIKANAAKRGKEVVEAKGCGEGCASCNGCGGKVFPTGNEE